MISGIILASGFSRRFASDKLTYRISGKPLLEYVVKNCIESKLDEVILVYRKKEIFDYLKNYDIKLVENVNADEGMSVSLVLGVKNALDETNGYMILMGDQILFDSHDINRMIEEFEKEDEIVAASYDGIRKTPVIFPSRYSGKLLKLKGDEGGRSILKDEANKRVYVDYDGMKAIDIDQAEDVETVLKHLENTK